PASQAGQSVAYRDTLRCEVHRLNTHSRQPLHMESQAKLGRVERPPAGRKMLEVEQSYYRYHQF
ncbi:hypothetical protein KL939_001645, partial [Ogataea angusta]